jgi:DNA-directed RNA polymerase specialized sigma24 family protein
VATLLVATAAGLVFHPLVSLPDAAVLEPQAQKQGPCADAADQLALFLAHRSALVGYATPILKCRARAEDVVQEAYIREFPGPTRPTPRTSPTSRATTGATSA